MEHFSGPIEKLLELIEDKKLDITEVSLRSVTEEFLKYLEEIKDVAENENIPVSSRLRLRVIVDFLSVASRLILIKSRSLIPDAPSLPEEEESIADLERRLLMFKALRPAMKRLAEAWATSSPMYARPYFLTLPPSIFRGWGGGDFFFPGNNLNAQSLPENLDSLFSVFRSILQEEKTIQEKLVSLEAEMSRVVSRITSLGSTSMKELSGSSGKRGEIIVLFLALLHLAREQAIRLNQEVPFSDILIAPANS